MSGVMRADICDILPGVEDIEDIIGAEDVTPRDRYHNKPVPVPKVRKPKKTKPQVGPKTTRPPSLLPDLAQFNVSNFCRIKNTF